MEKIVLLCVSSQGVINFRTELIKTLQAKGYIVSVVAFDDDYEKEIVDLGVDFYHINDKNRSTNPLKILSLKKKYKKILKKIRPNIVFTFMLKPNTFGVLSAKSLGIKEIYSMVEGAGDVFVNGGLKWRGIRFVACKLYKKAFRYAKKVFFLNNDDKAEFLQRKLVKEEQCKIIRGIGVDLEKFAYKSAKNDKTFLMVARMLQTKGVYEYCKCARLVRQKYPDAVFNYLGGEGTVKLADIQEYINDGSIHYLGTTKDVRPYLEDCLVVLLSSYREGMPMSIMEAEAVGRAIITSNSVGCKDTVLNGYNGFLVEQKDYVAMAEKCIWAIENFEKAQEMGQNARKFAEENFDAKKINEIIIENIENSYETEKSSAFAI